ncbi:MAG: 6-phosphogluconolactonase [Candidatus Binatia bacterium]
MSAPIRTTICKDASDMAKRVAERVSELSREPRDRPVSIALSGGSTPKRLYEALAEPALFDQTNWRQLELFFGDERSVPPEHRESNYGMAYKTLLSKVPSTVHRMVAEQGKAEDYEQLVKSRVPARTGSIPSFDLILLGMGPDGHTASLFPGTRALEERERLVVMNEVPQMKTRRMTFTYPLLNAAERVWVLIAGKDKQEKVSECTAARARGEKPYPILGIEPTQGELVWWLDEAALGK